MHVLLLPLFQSISISALDVGVGTESVDVVRTEPPAPVPIVTIRVRLQYICFSQLVNTQCGVATDALCTMTQNLLFS